jgi:hypothetical protein
LVLRRVILRCRIAFVAAVLLVLAPAGLNAQQRVGVNSAVNPDASGTPPGGTTRRLVIGQEVVFNERISTGPQGQTQLLFLDESAMSIGPGSDLTIDQFVYDPNAGTGKLAMSATRGVLRFIGGKLSKQEDAVTLRTQSATVAVRGGVFLLELQASGQLEVFFVFGKELSVTGLNGVVQTLTRPGFGVTVARPGASPSAPFRAPAQTLGQVLSQLDGRAGGNGGALQTPTDATVADSAVPATVSANVKTSVEQASAQAQAQTQTPINPTAPNLATAQTSLQVNTVQNQGSAPILQSINQCSGGQCGPFPPSPPSPTPPTPQPPTPQPPTPQPPTPQPPVAVTYAGLFKQTNGNGSGRGFIDQSAVARVPYINGTLQNGVFTVSFPVLGNAVTSFPLTPGTNAVGPAGTASPQGPFTGTTYLSSDGTFFYGTGTPTQTPSERGFIFGGQPVSTSFYAPLANTQITAFNLQQDIALGSAIPYLPADFGGSIPNPSVSPLYLVTPAGQQFGAFNSATNPNVVAPRWLQASIAVNGQGPSQTSALAVNTGAFFTSSDTGTVVGSGPVRGSFTTQGGRPTRIDSGTATVPDGNNNNLFGNNSISGFVLDQNLYNTTDHFQQSLAAVLPSGGNQINYAFTHPAIPTALPSGVGTSRTSQTLTGFIGGIMYPDATGAPYALFGANALATDATSNRVVAVFAGVDPFTSTTSGVQSMVINFGSLTGNNTARSTFIDDATFAAAESPTIPSTVNSVSTPPGLTAGQPGTRVAMVTANTAPLPSGFLPTVCQCQFMQWGYWTGELDQVNANNQVTRFDRANINFWVAGQLPVTLPTTGTGTYNGTAIGSVSNNNQNYIAAGNFTTTFNFGNNTGTLGISNFDGRAVSGTVAGAGGIYAGPLNGTNLSGLAQGRFFGSNAVETGGSFAFRSSSGSPYTAAGIFYGR